MGTIKQNRANNIVTGGKIDATDGLNNNVPAANIANASLTNVTAYPPSAGAGVSQLASDPPSPTEGQMWYNTTTNTLKQYALGAGAWATGGNLNTARYVPGGGGTSTAGIMFAGSVGPSVSNTELYNGTSWTEVNDINTARERISPAANTQTAALGSGGSIAPGYSNTAATESWNGTSWTEVNDLNTTGNGQFGFGTNTAAINVGGAPPPGQNVTQVWNGTSWTTSPATLNQGRKDAENGGMGTSTAGLIAGGNNGSPAYGQTESWNGSAWTELNDLNTARTAMVLSGTQTSGLAFGGQPAATNGALTEEWNGTTWSETTDMSSSRRNLAGSMGTETTTALAFGGIGPTPGAVTATEEWTKAVAIQTITAS